MFTFTKFTTSGLQNSRCGKCCQVLATKMLSWGCVLSQSTFHVVMLLCSVTESELKRLKEAFKRSSSLSGYMSKNAFFREVLGDNVPLRLAEVTCSAVQCYWLMMIMIIIVILIMILMTTLIIVEPLLHIRY